MITTIIGLIGGIFALLWGSQVKERIALTQKKNEIGEAVVENHEVAAQVAAAQTDEEADAALLADRKSDHR